MGRRRRLVEAAVDFRDYVVLIFSNLISFTKYSFKDMLVFTLKNVS